MHSLKDYQDFLEYLSGQVKPTSYRSLMRKFNLDKEGLEKLFKHMQKYYDNAGHIKGKEHDWECHLVEINHQGIEYLRNLETHELTKSQNKFNRVIALTGSIIAFTVLWNYVDRILGENIGVLLTPTQLIVFIISICITGSLFFLLGKETVSIYFKK